MEGNLAPLQAMSSLQHEFHQVNGDLFYTANTAG